MLIIFFGMVNWLCISFVEKGKKVFKSICRASRESFEKFDMGRLVGETRVGV